MDFAPLMLIHAPSPHALATWLAFPSLATVDTVLKCAAVIVGGAWTYLNYVRGRTYRKRLELELSGSLLAHGEVWFFSGECVARNVGLGKIPVVQLGTGATVWALRLIGSGANADTADEWVASLPLFANHGWVEPGEAIREAIFVKLPPAAPSLLGVRLEVLVNNGKTVWSAVQIVFADPPKPKETHHA